MKELSLNILDISQNSIKAEATVIYITIVENDETLTVTVEDDTKGRTRNTVSQGGGRADGRRVLDNVKKQRGIPRQSRHRDKSELFQKTS